MSSFSLKQRIQSCQENLKYFARKYTKPEHEFKYVEDKALVEQWFQAGDLNTEKYRKYGGKQAPLTLSKEQHKVHLSAGGKGLREVFGSSATIMKSHILNKFTEFGHAPPSLTLPPLQLKITKELEKHGATLSKLEA